MQSWRVKHLGRRTNSRLMIGPGQAPSPLTVNFSYSASEPLVLKNLTVVFAPREKVIVFIPTCACLLVCTVHDMDWYAGSVEGVILFYLALFSNQLLKGHHIVLLSLKNYTICDSWNTYHVIKTVQVNPFVPNLHFELPDGDNYSFTIRERRGQGRGVRKERVKQGEMVEDDWNCV